MNGRKLSISQGQGGVSTFGVTSPTSSSRPGTRRKETSDNAPYSSLASPAGTGRFGRDESSSYFNRKSTDTKDAFGGGGDTEDRSGEGAATGSNSKNALPFGGLMRTNTGGSAFGNGPASPWGATTAMSPMGNFGSFAMNSGSIQSPSEKRPGYGSMRGESRLAALMPRTSTEELASKVPETNRASDNAKSWRSRQRTEDPFGDDSASSANAANDGSRDLVALLARQQQNAVLNAATRQADFGMSDTPGFRDSLQHRDDVQQTPQAKRTSGQSFQSPTDTNPYGSPDGGDFDDVDRSHTESEAQHQYKGQGFAGLHDTVPSHYSGLPKGFGAGFEGIDRSQTSSAGSSRPFGGLGGLPSLSNLGGWPTQAPNPIGTPDRERSFGAFGNSLFSPLGEGQQSGLGSIGQPFGSSTNLAGTASIGRGSKLGSLFPAAMQAQMQHADNEGSIDSDRQSAFGAIGRNNFGLNRDTDSPMRSGRGVFDDLLANLDARGHAPSSSAELPQSLAAPARSTPLYSPAVSAAPGYQQSPATTEANALPPAQQRTMVMPDRMRWVYLDPQGQVQGPWSGLEMHDWYKASFFTADLSVKKLEDDEFEPLGQLIRRIGNSREPFLVPQIGIPHGPPAVQAGPFASAAAGSAISPSGVVQPPFAGAFPSFGTTLTAEQQNNLERRKQEEQYLMARQREFLAQQQVNMKLQMQGVIPGSLHHHSSAHSLQSQPSFGSIASPIGMPPQQVPMSGGPGSFFDNTPRPLHNPNMGLPQDFLREEELARLSLQDRQAFGHIAPPQQQQPQQYPFPQPGPQHDARLEHAEEDDPEGFEARLREFNELRAQHDMEQALAQANEQLHEPVAQPQQPVAVNTQAPIEEKSKAAEKEVLTLTEQIKATSAKQTPVAQPESSPWAKVNTGVPIAPFPPPQTTTPLPAPTAVRGRSNLPETLNAGSRSRSETPEVATPSIAPWAKEPTEAPKGPSLKEIQEAEAKKAAKIEEAAAAARRAALEQELRNQAAAPVAVPALPTTATWATSSSPAPAVPAASPWAKPAVAAKAAASPATSKKTLADIQKEEELRKQKLVAAAAAVAAPGLPAVAAGKRYADLASKPSTTSPSPAGAAAWSTVGAGGKVKTSAAAVATPSRPATTASVPAASAVKAVRPAVTTARSTTAIPSGAGGVTLAHQEFNKWAKNELSKGLNSDINGELIFLPVPLLSHRILLHTNLSPATVDEFIRMLADFPAESSVIADAVYAASQLMNGRSFADEFLRRKKLADKGVVETAPGGGFATAAGGAQGWSEVAKKGPVKEEPAAPAMGFKVVPGKKGKGRK